MSGKVLKGRITFVFRDNMTNLHEQSKIYFNLLEFMTIQQRCLKLINMQKFNSNPIYQSLSLGFL